jgi:hypothetical protein
LGWSLRKGKLWRIRQTGFTDHFAHKKADFHPPDDLQKINP